MVRVVPVVSAVCMSAAGMAVSAMSAAVLAPARVAATGVTDMWACSRGMACVRATGVRSMAEITPVRPQIM